MTIQHTTNFGIAYADAQTALGDLGAVTQQVAESLDAAMGRAGYTPPDSTDFAALTARVGALEAPAPGAVTLAAGFAQYSTAPYGELVRCYKLSPTRIKLVGMVSVTTAVAQGAAAVTFGALPAGYAPAVTVNRTAFYQSTNPCRITIQANGTLGIVPAVALAAAQWFQLECEYRTVNT